MKDKISLGNVFEELGFAEFEANNLIIRAQLLRTVISHIKLNQLAHSKAAEVFGVNKGYIRELLAGKMSVFTVDTLVNMLIRAGFEIRIDCQLANIQNLSKFLDQ